MKAYLSQYNDSSCGSYLSFNIQNNKIIDNDFKWEEEGGEFRYRGELYDVVSVKKINNTITICCLKDGNENKLEKQVNNIHKNNNTKTPSSALSLLKFFSAFFMPDKESPIFYYSLDTQTGSIANETSVANNIEVIKPPPRC